VGFEKDSVRGGNASAVASMEGVRRFAGKSLIISGRAAPVADGEQNTKKHHNPWGKITHTSGSISTQWQHMSPTPQPVSNNKLQSTMVPGAPTPRLIY